MLYLAVIIKVTYCNFEIEFKKGMDNGNEKVLTYMWGTFDVIVFKDIFGSFVTLEKWLILKNGWL